MKTKPSKLSIGINSNVSVTPIVFSNLPVRNNRPNNSNVFTERSSFAKNAVRAARF